MADITLIAELATNHGGDLDLAKKMCDYAAAGGATHVKTQAYKPESVNPNDPQAAWLVQSALSEADHRALKAHCDALGVTYFASVFDNLSMDFIAGLCGCAKFASSSPLRMPRAGGARYKSYPWRHPYPDEGVRVGLDLLTIPLYPAPLECVGMLDIRNGIGWSDHCEGLAGCEYAIARGSRVVEVHVSIPGEGRNCVFDKTQSDLKRIRDWMETCETISSGIPRRFRERWVR